MQVFKPVTGQFDKLAQYTSQSHMTKTFVRWAHQWLANQHWIAMAVYVLWMACVVTGLIVWSFVMLAGVAVLHVMAMIWSAVSHK